MASHRNDPVPPQGAQAPHKKGFLANIANIANIRTSVTLSASAAGTPIRALRWYVYGSSPQLQADRSPTSPIAGPAAFPLHTGQTAGGPSVQKQFCGNGDHCINKGLLGSALGGLHGKEGHCPPCCEWADLKDALPYQSHAAADFERCNRGAGHPDEPAWDQAWPEYRCVTGSMDRRHARNAPHRPLRNSDIEKYRYGGGGPLPSQTPSLGDGHALIRNHKNPKDVRIINVAAMHPDPRFYLQQGGAVNPRFLLTRRTDVL
jgi:hypothetical protein